MSLHRLHILIITAMDKVIGAICVMQGKVLLLMMILRIIILAGLDTQFRMQQGRIYLIMNVNGSLIICMFGSIPFHLRRILIGNDFDGSCLEKVSAFLV